MKKPNDRLQPVLLLADNPSEPKIYLVVNNQKFIRPGLETYYAKPGQQATTTSNCSCNPVVGTYCSCNKVCTCNPQASCSCNSHSSCSCVGHSSGGGGSYCSCVPVH
jgi:hypothetical protein